jgi:hypothetical protein
MRNSRKPCAPTIALPIYLTPTKYIPFIPDLHSHIARTCTIIIPCTHLAFVRCSGLTRAHHSGTFHLCALPLTVLCILLLPPTSVARSSIHLHTPKCTHTYYDWALSNEYYSSIGRLCSANTLHAHCCRTPIFIHHTSTHVISRISYLVYYSTCVLYLRAANMHTDVVLMNMCLE